MTNRRLAVVLCVALVLGVVRADESGPAETAPALASPADCPSLAGSIQRRCRAANAAPEPDFKYFSNLSARVSSENDDDIYLPRTPVGGVWTASAVMCREASGH